MTVHHIGYLTKSMPDGIREMEVLGYRIEHEIVRDKRRGIDIVFLTNHSEEISIRVELICPYTENSVVHNLLSKRGSGTYHICYESDNLLEDIAKFR